MVGSIALKGNAFIETVKKRPDTLVITVSEKNRNDLAEKFFTRESRSC